MCIERKWAIHYECTHPEERGAVNTKLHKHTSDVQQCQLQQVITTAYIYAINFINAVILY